MFYIILSVILVIVLFVVLGYDYTQKRWRINSKQLLMVFGLVPIIFGMFVMVNANRVGVLFDPLGGGVQDVLLQEGLQVKAPYQTVYELSTEVTEITFENISVQTNDSQWLNTTVQLQVSIDKAKAFDYFKKHRDKELNEIQSILKSTAQKELEIIATNYSVYDVLGGSRAEVVNSTFAALEAELIKDGIVLQRLVLVDTDAGDTIEGAIALEAAAKKEAEAAQWLRIKAEEEGAALVIKAEKEKEANELLTLSLTPEVLEKMRIDLYLEKWDGKLPTVVSGDGSGLIIDISGMATE
jgi:regulator of protease activity HflC (stomatin/prohibitin superfamily)